MRRTVAESMLELVGGTPLVPLRRLGRAPDDFERGGRAEVLAKIEAWNPSGSSMDRIARALAERAIAEGRLAPGGTVVTASSGDFGVALALFAAEHGFRCVVAMPESMSLERRLLVRSYGAELVLTAPEEQIEGAIRRAQELAVEKSATLLEPYGDAGNAEEHGRSTAEEILTALAGRVPDAFVAGIGSGGTLVGVGRVLRARFGKAITIVGVEPASSATVSRGERGPTKIQGLGPGLVPPAYDPSVVDAVRTVSDRAAWDTKTALATREGLLVGISSGAVAAVALALAEELGEGKIVVTVFPDNGERDFSLATFFEEPPDERGAPA